MRIQLGCTPDADDAYMLYGLTSGGVDGGDITIETVEAPLPVLNDRASRGDLEATMLSAGAYPFVRSRYALLGAGSSFGLGCGPVVVSREPLAPEALDRAIVAIPGSTTTAYAMLQLYCPTIRTRVLPFDKLLQAVETGLVECALVIHQEFMTYGDYGLHVVVDLGVWWAGAFGGLPMPVTCFAVRRDVPTDIQRRVNDLLSRSVRFAREHHDEAMAHAMAYAGAADAAAVDAFVRHYVNDLSEDMGADGRKALETFLDKAAFAGVLPEAMPVDVVGSA